MLLNITRVRNRYSIIFSNTEERDYMELKGSRRRMEDTAQWGAS
jgi:hypothetical protein